MTNPLNMPDQPGEPTPPGEDDPVPYQTLGEPPTSAPENPPQPPPRDVDEEADKLADRDEGD